MGKQRGEIGIGRLVIDNKPCIDRRAMGLHRVAVPAQPWLGFEQRDLVPLRQQPGSGQPRNAGAHHGNG